jgi:hypothetical protein
MPRRNRNWIWSGRIAAALIVLGLVGYLFAVGLGTAGQLGSAAAAVVALAALLAPYVLPPPPSKGLPVSGIGQVEHSGDAMSSGGGQANTGLQTMRQAGSSQVRGSGNARADGPGSVANTGVIQITLGPER